MAAIDKIYGTKSQCIELRNWLKKNRKRYLKCMRSAKGMKENEDWPISNFSKEADLYLLTNCPIKWVTDYIKCQYGLRKWDWE